MILNQNRAQITILNDTGERRKKRTYCERVMYISFLEEDERTGEGRTITISARKLMIHCDVHGINSCGPAYTARTHKPIICICAHAYVCVCSRAKAPETCT